MRSTCCSLARTCGDRWESTVADSWRNKPTAASASSVWKPFIGQLLNAEHGQATRWTPSRKSQEKERKMTREKLLPEVLKELWQSVDEQRLSREQFYDEQQRHLDAYRQIWRCALALEGHPDLRESLLWELGTYVGCDD